KGRDGLVVRRGSIVYAGHGYSDGDRFTGLPMPVDGDIRKGDVARFAHRRSCRSDPGLYWKTPPTFSTLPLPVAGCVSMAKVSVVGSSSLSGSSPLKVSGTAGPSSTAVAVVGLAIGASLTPSIVSVTVAVLTPPRLSSMV